MTHPLDNCRPKLDKIISDHPLFHELKSKIDILISNRYKKSKKLAGQEWKGYHSNSQYLSERTLNNLSGNKISAIQLTILQDIDLLNDRSFEFFRTYSVDFDKVRLWPEYK